MTATDTPTIYCDLPSQRPFNRMEELGRLARTVAHLHPAQIFHRARLRSQRLIDPWWGSRTPLLAANARPRGSAWPATFRATGSGLDHGDAQQIAGGTFEFLKEERRLGDPPDWEQRGASHLWRFHLHYFEWAWALAQADDRRWARQAFAELWRSWSASATMRNRDAWAPYVVSLRAWVLCDVFDRLAKGAVIEEEILGSLWRHTLFLRSHLELDVGGNHLIKNLKALLALGVFFDRADIRDRAARRLGRQLQVQVLADGGHYERSPSYHCQVLADLLDVRGLLQAAAAPAIAGLDEAIAQMRRWLGVMVAPDGQLPMFNDSFAVPAELLELLGPVPCSERLVVLEESGYVVARPERRSQLVMDVGDPCPDELPAHAHADCLSFELWVDATKVITDTGTSTYEPGPRRDYERSTAAHNTVEVAGANQTEVWGAFRAGRRAHGTLHSVVDDGQKITVTASHDGYRHLAGSPVYRRTWMAGPGTLRVFDQPFGGDTLPAVSRLHAQLASHIPIRIEGIGGPVLTGSCYAATSFADLVPAVEHRLTKQPFETDRTMGWNVTWD